MRTKLLGLLATIAVSSLCFASCGGGAGQTGGKSTTGPDSTNTPGCYLPSDSVGNVGCGVLSSFGDPTADATFGMEVNVQTQFWQGIPATVQVLDDCNGANAFSLPNGNIVYGIRLFQQLVVSYGGDAAPISGVLAHEWGHQVQFDNGWFVSTEPTSRPIELEADAFSGYYMALGETYTWQSISNYLQAVANTGDFNFTDPGHHGTPQERLAAAQLGFQTAEQAAATQTQLAYSDLHQIFSSSISSFSARQSATPEVPSASAKTVLSRLDLQEVYNILDGSTRGRDRVIRRTPELKNLYPTL
jgi:hypothetical protein